MKICSCLQSLRGTLNGLLWAGYDKSLKAHLFCAPLKRSLTGENLLQLTDDFINKNPSYVDQSFDLASREALENAFLCNVDN